MFDQSKAHDVFDRIKKHSTADDVEVLIVGGRNALTRFANNTITQNVAEENYEISVRTVVDGRTARATTNKFDDESLRRVVQASERLAKVQDADPDLLPIVTVAEATGGNAPAAIPSRHFARTVAVGPQERASGVESMVAVAHKHGHTSAGVYAVSEHVEALLNSRGVSAWHTQSHAEVSVTMLARDSSGWQKSNSPDVDQIDPARLAEVAAEKASSSAGPKEIPPGKYTVIFEPSAVQDIVGFMFWDFSGLSLLDQRSFLTDRVGKKLFGDNISVYDDVYHPLQSGAPFDGEGVRRARVELIRNGVVRNLVYSRGSAARMCKTELAAQAGDVRATGHGFPLPNEMGEAPLNIVFAGDGAAKSVDQMVAETERGILVTRLWYIREVDPYEKIVTGMTRDGTFLVENGKVRNGLLNFRFNQSLPEMLSNVEAMGEPVRASGEESFDMVVPAMKVRDFNFTEVTKF
ncbi:MAG TPA: TldD/PmbA family protein [Clostridia bacterium]|nr:TldD/PmbA family protein [Clostridia bacterium]